jgi:23S rRNA (cytidine1920-2'-O)/16S rRNA (cytidine1409-2'-O)-methyltransferase
VDVGYNQLDYRLRKDMRVVVCERTNVMSLSSQDFPFTPDAAVVDLSFRSIRKAAVHLLNLVDSGWLIALIKPQYEWQNPDTRFSGVVHSVDLQGILEILIIDLNSEGAFVSNMMLSPIRGRKGNREFFFLLSLKQTLDQKQLQRMLKMTLQTGNESGGKGIP